MKTLIFYLSLIVGVSIGYAQEQKITRLEEAKVGFAPLDSKITRIGDDFSYSVNEDYAGEFYENAIGFMKANFDIKNFILEFDDENYTSYKKYDEYLVTFASSKGYLSANFDKKGKLVNTYQKFTDIILPIDIMREVYRDNKGWTVTSNKYIASGRGDILDKEVYKIKLENGNQKRNIKLDPRSAETTVADLE